MKSKQVYSESKGNRNHITVHVCVSAVERLLPPFIIFIGKPSRWI